MIKEIFHQEVARGLEVGMPSNIKGMEAAYCAIFNFDYIGNRETDMNKYKQLYMCLTRASVGVFINSHQSENKEYQAICALLNERETKKVA